MARAVWAGVVGLVAVFAFTCDGAAAPRSRTAVHGASEPAAPCPATGDPVTVAAIDERLELTLADGRIVRLAGLEPPRATAMAPSRPAEVVAAVRTRLAQGLVTVATLGATDRWRTEPAVVFVDETPLAIRLLEDGMVRAWPEHASHPCRVDLLAAEARARTRSAGVWADPDLSVVPADTGSAAAPATSGMVVVEGAVASVGETAARLFINLGRARGGFAISLSRRNTDLMGSETMRSARQIGARVRVRGLLDRTGDPHVDITDADALEILPEPPAPGSFGQP